MPAIDLVIEGKVSRSHRARQLEAMFDVPASEKTRLEWHGNLPLTERPWSVGLIVGPSGCGKSTILRHLFGEPKALAWTGDSVVDDFDASNSIETIATVCQAVGFNTIPAWLRRFDVLSNGEQFRVQMARRLLDDGKMIVMDEFTSVVDRQVARIGAHAVQKFIRKTDKQFVAASCHYDVIDWLQPDWLFEPATMTFTWRELQRRPAIDCAICRVPYSAWAVFAPFHYLTAEMARSARCFGLFVDDRLASFAGVLYRPHPTAKNIVGVSRLVTLPDFQGLGLAMILVDRLGAAYKGRKMRLRTYPAHPALIRSFDKSPVWKMTKRPGMFSPATGKTSQIGSFGGRPCGVFEYIGAAMDATAGAGLLAH